MSSRARTLAVCSALVIALLAVAAFVPLPFSIAYPGPAANVLGEHKGEPVITVHGAKARKTSGELRMTAIVATGPQVSARLPEVLKAWFRRDEAVMPRDTVYPVGDNTEEVAKHNAAQMKESQDAAVGAALRYLHRSPKDVRVDLELADVGGPSAGLLFTLGIIDTIDGDGAGHDLTGGRSIAGTGTITTDGKIGPVGGVALKTQAAHREGAKYFLVPKDECSDARANLPEDMRLIPVTTLSGTVDSLKALNSGGKVPSC
ncbi:YlbL family protein [Streptomyces sp. CA-132043]|uniref:YlbL family protein n=1 Tax=Streptomyces sp. CA-132043 TaxID=3240048 RepID=UPI003D90AF97